MRARARALASHLQRLAGKGNELGPAIGNSPPGKIEVPTAHQPEELVYLMRRNPYVSCYPADCPKHLNVVLRVAQSQLREYLLDVHVRFAEIREAHLFEEVTRQGESDPI